MDKIWDMLCFKNIYANNAVEYYVRVDRQFCPGGCFLITALDFLFIQNSLLPERREIKLAIAAIEADLQVRSVS